MATLFWYSSLRCQGMKLLKPLKSIRGLANRYATFHWDYIHTQRYIFCAYCMNFLFDSQATNLSEFYEVCRGLELARNFQFPNLREVVYVVVRLAYTTFFFHHLCGLLIHFLLTIFQPPQSFLATMEEYIREAPRVVSVPSEALVRFCNPTVTT